MNSQDFYTIPSQAPPSPTPISPQLSLQSNPSLSEERIFYTLKDNRLGIKMKRKQQLLIENMNLPRMKGISYWFISAAWILLKNKLSNFEGSIENLSQLNCLRKDPMNLHSFILI